VVGDGREDVVVVVGVGLCLEVGGVHVKAGGGGAELDGTAESEVVHWQDAALKEYRLIKIV